MKIIIVHDSDGHVFGIPHTEENVKKVVDAAIEAGVNRDDFDELPVGRKFGGMCDIIDTDSLRAFPKWNPFM
jgi:hypothetical protein